MIKSILCKIEYLKIFLVAALQFCLSKSLYHDYLRCIEIGLQKPENMKRKMNYYNSKLEI